MNRKKLIIGSIILLIIICTFVIILNFGKPSLLGNVSLNQEFTLRKNQVVNISYGKENLKIKLEDIVDNRCPSNVECIWQGEIIAKLTINNEQYELGSVRKTTVSINNTNYSIIFLPEYSVDSAKFIIK